MALPVTLSGGLRCYDRNLWYPADFVLLHGPELSTILLHNLLEVLCFSVHVVLPIVRAQYFVVLENVDNIRSHYACPFCDIHDRETAALILEQKVQNYMRPVTHVCPVPQITQWPLRSALLLLD